MNFIEAALRANQEIYALIRSDLDKSYFLPISDDAIGAGGDQSLKIDVVAEEIFIKHLSSFGVINSEECGVVGKGADEIVIDPIDGSSNIASGFPFFGTSVALKQSGKVAISMVCNLANGDIFVRDENRTYRRTVLSERELPIDLGFDPKVALFEKAYTRPDIVSGLKSLKIKFRSPGAVALSLAYAHTVKFVLFVGKHREYDIIAGLHLSEDLHRYIDDEVILVSKDRATFEAIKELFVGSTQ